MKKTVIIILTIGIILRFFLASTTCHSDLAALAFAAAGFISIFRKRVRLISLE